MHLHACVCVFPGEGDSNKSCINMELNRVGLQMAAHVELARTLQRTTAAFVSPVFGTGAAL